MHVGVLMGAMHVCGPLCLWVGDVAQARDVPVWEREMKVSEVQCQSLLSPLAQAPERLACLEVILFNLGNLPG